MERLRDLLLSRLQRGPDAILAHPGSA